MSGRDVAPPSPETRARVVAVIRAHRLDGVVAALAGARPRDLLIEQVRGYGRQKGHLEVYEGGGFEGGFLPKVRLEFSVRSEDVRVAVEAVCAAARSGRIGDGKIFVHAVEGV